MSSKKQHEVEILSSFISMIAKSTNVENLIDLGAGQGYLSSVLAFECGLNILGVDIDPIQTSGAERRANTLRKRSKSKSELGHLQYLNKKITAEDTFDQLVSASDSIQTPENIAGKWGLIGLHTCGDLSPMTLRMWRQSSASLIVNVGCCYNHVSEEDEMFEDASSLTLEERLKQKVIKSSRKPRILLQNPGADTTASKNSDVYGFPMSKCVNNFGIKLGWTARMLACQSTCRWVVQGKEAQDSFLRHLYRALLQSLIYSVTGVSPVVSIPTTKARRGSLPPFSKYAAEASQRLLDDPLLNKNSWVHTLANNLPPIPELDKMFNATIEKLGLRQIAFIWTLRALMAEAIESLILIDRYIWIKEQTDFQVQYKPMLFPLFEHVESPRNCVLVGIKVRKDDTAALPRHD
jgi:hypothetical protein